MKKKWAKQQILKKIKSFPQWYYQFELKHGIKTKINKFMPEHYTPAQMADVHKKRANHILQPLQKILGTKIRQMEVIDFACNGGYYSIEILKKGAKRVLGIDEKKIHIEQAKFISEVLELKNIEFREMNAYKANVETVGAFDISICIGLIYHTNQPMLLLKNIYDVTKYIAIIESYVSDRPDSVLEVNYEDNSKLNNARNDSIVFIPSKSSLIRMLRATGFKNIMQMLKTPDLHEFYLKDRIVTFLAFK